MTPARAHFPARWFFMNVAQMNASVASNARNAHFEKMNVFGVSDFLAREMEAK